MNKQLQQEWLNCPIGELEGMDDTKGNSEVSSEDACNDPAPSLPQHIDPNSQPSTGTMMHMEPRLPANSSASIHAMPPSTRTASFIEQVLLILDDAQLYNFEHIVSWQPDGVSFKVHRIRDFETKILPRYLEQTKVRSFQRQ